MFNGFFFFICLGIGSEICARIMEHESFFHLDAPIIRVTGTHNHSRTTFSASLITLGLRLSILINLCFLI